MRYLNKIIFINSATIKYAEVNLDGNVHFIGTQGVGKSTLLRAILFFYNADTQKLGIPKEKKNYTEYYFPYGNSYVVYEVNTEAGLFCIVSYKSQGRVSFRFFDGPYQQKYFIDSNGAVFDSWDKTRALLDAEKVKYTNKIDRYEEYKDILYGNTDGKNNALKKYALLESKQYQNIPRTIQNVLLNSKLEAEFIKQTIIMSLNEEDIQIELNNYTHHLRGFETQLNDIRQFKQPSVGKLADTVASLLGNVRSLEREKYALAGYVAWAHHHALDSEPKQTDKLEKEKLQEQAARARLKKAEETYDEKKQEKNSQISILNEKLRTAKQKSDEYERMDIKSIIARVALKNDLDAKNKNLTGEREILSAQYKDITKRYDALLTEIDAQRIEYKNTKETEKINLKDAFQKYKADAEVDTKKQVNEISLQYKSEIDAANENLSIRTKQTIDLRINNADIRHRRYYDEEIAALNNEIAELKGNIQKTSNEINLYKARIEVLQTQWNNELERRKEVYENQKSKIEEKINSHLASISSIDEKVSNSKDSLYAWLEGQKPGWADTIGRVIDADVLFQDNLNPHLSDKKGDSLYGVSINLTEIKKEVKTIADYEQDRADLTKEINKYRKDQDELTDAYAGDVEKLRKKYQSKINDTKKSIQEQEYALGVSDTRLDEAIIALSDYAAKAKAEKEQALIDSAAGIRKAEENENEARAALSKIEEERTKKIKEKEKEADKKIKAEQLSLNESLGRIDAMVMDKNRASDQQKAAILHQQKNELIDKGADTRRLDAIDSEILGINAELKFIDENRDRVAEYNKDKRELFDKVEEFKAQKQLLEQQLTTETQKHQIKKEGILKELSDIGRGIKDMEEMLGHIREDIGAFGQLALTDVWINIDDIHKQVKDKNKTTKRVSVLRIEMIQTDATAIAKLSELKEAINKFTGYFSAQNIFNFKTNLSGTSEYLEFADDLREFMEDAKISEYEKRVSERYASIIHSIGQETATLLSRSGEISKIITQINNDFERKNFVGAIKKIELKLEESANKIVQLLIKIKTFNDENSFDLGASNLFTSDNQDAKNKLAVELLKQLLSEISEFRRDQVSLSDSFELKFRVVENQNDTSWVEKLSNVGSEGTDILVKAMINIMLLNVFKDGASKRFKDFRLHCVMDEIGKLHPNNVKGILQFANDRNIYLINGSPTESNALNYKHIYKLEKDEKSYTKVKRILSNHA
jgi:hypothetical protein